MESKKQRLSKRALNTAPLEEYNNEKFVTLEASRRYTLIARNRTCIKEKGFEHTDDFFVKGIAIKGWKKLCKPPKPAAISVVREFYENLADQGLKKG